MIKPSSYQKPSYQQMECEFLRNEALLQATTISIMGDRLSVR